MSENKNGRKKFELPGSKPHYAPSLSFTINNMRLKLEPDFINYTITCDQILEITALQDIRNIELDVAELHINSVSSITNGKHNSLDFRILEHKLNIKIDEELKEKESIQLVISYSSRPRKGFYFISPDKHYPNKRIEAWTQGETTEAKYWFPCIDHPQIKFSSEISIRVPAGFTAISNGKLLGVEEEEENNHEKIKGHIYYHWSEPNPHPAYLTSVVIGKYTERKEDTNELLYYYVPEDRSQDAVNSFGHTAEMIRFFENYLETKYPYAKYSQVTVQDFVYGGMENSSCTTLTQDTLHDKRAHLDYTSDHLISHELAHQWFGDFITCRDWQHIWLNEGFATYCEALYWQASRGNDEFQYYMMQTADDYLEEARGRYIRPIVTKVYKHPDDLFDRHTYEKGSCVLHMLRHYVGDKYFRRSLKAYLQHFANGTAETDDLRKVFEKETGKNLQQFFDQWLFREGHPNLKIEFFHTSNGIAKIKVEQVMQPDGLAFEFSIEIKIALKKGEEKIYELDISENENTFQIPIGKEEEIEWMSVDPEFKLLKSISFKAPEEMLLKQLKNGRTVIERIEAARALKSNSSEATIDGLKTAILQDKFWGVAGEAASTLGSIKTEYAYQALKESISVKHPKARRAVVKAIGEFRKEETIELLTPILHNDESYFVESEAAVAIGKTKNNVAIPILKEFAKTETFQNVVAQGAITGLKEFSGNKEIAEFILAETKYGRHHRIRETATFALGKFVEDNPVVFDHLRSLLTDKWFRVRINACRALADAESTKAIADLEWVVENDIDHRVKRIAEECVNMIKDATKKPKEVAQLREEIDRVRSKNLELLQKMDRLEREIH
jgi:aminopeptidase N